MLARWRVTLGSSVVAILIVGCQGSPPSPPATTPEAAKPAPATAAAPALSSPAAGPAAASPVANPAAAAPVSPTSSPVAAASSPAAAAASPVAAASPATQPPCDFVLGFAKLRDQLGADTVGPCMENQREVPGNGTAVQRTARGTMVYRPQDNSMMFTDGARTWIDGPRGLLDRPANQRFEWESDRQAIEAIRRGGHYIYFRHTTTNRSEQDSDPTNLANCATQRNLTDEGRSQARAIGEAFRALNIPVGLVLSSEYCRALEHARLSFNAAQPEPSLVLPDPLTAEERQRNTEALLRILATPPPANTNVVMVSHSPNIRDAIGVDLPVEGGAVILKPNAGGKPTEVMKFLPTEWGPLAEALGSR